MGHSLGAALSTVVAATLPGMVDHVVLLEGFGPLTESEETTPERFGRALEDGERRRTAQKRVFAHPDEAVARLLKAGQPMTEAAARCLVGRGLVAVDGGFTWAADAALRVSSRQRLTEGQARAFLRRIVAPTLFIRAHPGWSADEVTLRERMACVARLRRVDVPGHHHVHLDDAALVAAHVMTFLAEDLQ